MSRHQQNRPATIIKQFKFKVRCLVCRLRMEQSRCPCVAPVKRAMLKIVRIHPHWGISHATTKYATIMNVMAANFRLGLRLAGLLVNNLPEPSSQERPSLLLLHKLSYAFAVCNLNRMNERHAPAPSTCTFIHSSLFIYVLVIFLLHTFTFVIDGRKRIVDEAPVKREKEK